MRQLLAVLLYTGCKVNHDLTNAMMEGNYKKYKYFIVSLKNAIEILSKFNPKKMPKLYSGLRNVFVGSKVEDSKKLGWFSAFISSSTDENVAIQFKG